MNSEYESKSQRNSALDMLMETNAAAVESLELTPYQPVVYAIPEEYRDAMLELLRASVEFQPTLYRQIESLATRTELTDHVMQIQKIETDYMSKTAQSVKMENREIARQMQESIRQAGSDQEKYFSAPSAEFDGKINKLDEILARMRQKIQRIMIAASASTVLLSILICTAFWLLVS